MKKLCILLLSLVCAFSAHANNLPLNTPVAFVDTQTITSYDVRKMQHDFSITGKTLTTEQALSLSIRQAIENNIAKQQNISISEEDINSAVLKVAQLNGLRTRSELMKKIAAEHLSPEDFLRHLKQDLLSQRLRVSIVQSLFQPSQNMIDTYIQQQAQTHASSLFLVKEEAFITHSEEEANLAEQKAQKIYTALNNSHEDFNKIVQDFSALQPEGMQHSGWIPAEPLLESLHKNSEDEITVPSAYPPIRTGNVIHVLQVLKKQQQPTPFTAVPQADVDVVRIMATPIRSLHTAEQQIQKAYAKVTQEHDSIEHLCNTYAEDNTTYLPDCHVGWISAFTPVFNDEALTETILSSTITSGWLPPQSMDGAWVLVHIRTHKTRPLPHTIINRFAIQMLRKEHVDEIYAAFLKAAYDKTYIFIFPEAVKHIDETPL